MKQHIFEFTGKYVHFEKKTLNEGEIRELMNLARVLSNEKYEMNYFKTCVLVTVPLVTLTLPEDEWL